ncbi:MAG: hypothetical protein IIA59_02530 [Candidatus Marinimicrobia bacterium]|nr:hypothetical protein [Candidatus Neomarinimicrobiota bacterium]
MADIKGTLATATGWLKSVTEFGLSVILALLILDILVAGEIGLIDNINTIVSSFAGNGVTGLIALLIFLLIYKK